MSQIRIQGLTKSFGATHAVGPIDLEIASGELLSLLGPSGCGKTTTLRMIAGLETPTRGAIWIGDRQVNEVPIERRDVGMVFQTYALFPHLTVFENVAFGLRLRRLPASEIESTVKANLALVGLADLAHRMPRQLSGGQQQRVSLARALANRPAVLLFDEPLSNLDLKLREQMRDEIRRLQRQVGTTAVYVTHDQSEAMAISDRIAVVNKGHIEQIATPRQIYERPSTLFVAQFIGQCSVFQGETRGTSFVTRGGFEVPLRGTCQSAIKSGPVAMVIRPESVALGKPGSGEPSHNAVVEDVVFLGDRAAIRLRVPPSGEILLAATQPEYGAPLPEAGTSVHFHIRSEQVIIVPAQDAAP